MAAELVGRRVSVIVASGLPAALAAKTATTTIPIIFRTGNDPVQYDLVTSFNRPTGNLTGINDFSVDLAQKRLQFLHDLLPGASRFAALTNATPLTASRISDLRAAASTIGVSIEIIRASDNREIDAAFASLARKRIDALFRYLRFVRHPSFATGTSGDLLPFARNISSTPIHRKSAD
jgi:putative ABC transport system substrate-binding protein